MTICWLCYGSCYVALSLAHSPNIHPYVYTHTHHKHTHRASLSPMASFKASSSRASYSTCISRCAQHLCKSTNMLAHKQVHTAWCTRWHASISCSCTDCADKQVLVTLEKQWWSNAAEQPGKLVQCVKIVAPFPPLCDHRACQRTNGTERSAKVFSVPPFPNCSWLHWRFYAPC